MMKGFVDKAIEDLLAGLSSDMQEEIDVMAGSDMLDIILKRLPMNMKLDTKNCIFPVAA